MAPSPIAPSGEAFIENDDGEAAFAPFVTPRALQLEEMPYVVQQFVRGAKNALAAGFDGVEVHAANGYLLDQFLQTATNRRTDEYGGSVENRGKILLQVIEAVNEVWDSGRVGVRLSPIGAFNDMADDNPEATFGYVVERLNDYDLAYLHVVRPRIPESRRVCRRLHQLRGWGHEKERTVLPRSAGAGGSDGFRSRARVQLTVVGDLLYFPEDRVYS